MKIRRLLFPSEYKFNLLINTFFLLTLPAQHKKYPLRYDEVVGTLDFARELTGQFTKLASDDAKDRKKQAKREQQEKARQELAKVTFNQNLGIELKMMVSSDPGCLHVVCARAVVKLGRGGRGG